VLAAAVVFGVGALLYYQTDSDAIATAAFVVPRLLLALVLIYLLARFVVWAARR
jgi:hypothetical protein